ncbi:MAG: replicative DNA helicase [Eggerthellaceae bacterium]|nr:replicative DNA helicase [Eggerthellaceae bacterium]
MAQQTQNFGNSRAKLTPAQQAVLPQDIQAEESVLSACVLDSEVAENIVSALTPESFAKPSHVVIFSAITDLVNRRIPVDPISLEDTLSSKNQLDAAGGQDALLDLTVNLFAVANWKRHVDIVRRNAMLRELVHVAADINALAYDAPDDLDVVVEEAERMLFNVTEKRVSSSFRSIRDLISETFEEITRISEKDGSMAGVPTGFTDVDALFHGFRGGDLIILAARPGVGKTALALNMAVNAAKQNTAVAYFSLEMSASQLVQRILSLEGSVKLSKIRQGDLNEGDWSELGEICNHLMPLDFYIDDTPGLTILEARAKARRELRNVGPDQHGLIIVDYLQLMSSPNQRREFNRNVEVGEISRGLKILAKEMNMPVLALSQLSRAVEMRGKKRPMLSDLRESGSIEQDADIVMFIDRSMDEAEAESDGRPPLGKAELIVAKHRNGPTKDIPLAFLPEYTRFNNFIDDSRIDGI